MISLARLDHWVLTVSDIDATCRFYTEALGCQTIRFGDNRRALRIGNSEQKINLHDTAHPFHPAAHTPQPGSADFCFITETPLNDVIAHFQQMGIVRLEGPVQRTGTMGAILSIYNPRPRW